MFTSEECLSDAPLMFYFVSSLYFLYISIKNDEIRNRGIIASGLFAGLGAWTKYNGLFIIFVILAIFVQQSFFSRKLKTRSTFSLRHVALFLVFFSILGSPWYIRNWSLVQNPVYPHLYQIFGGKDLDPWLMENSFEAHFTRIEALSGLDNSLSSILLTYVTVFFNIPPFEMTDMGPFLGAFILVGLFFFKSHKTENGFLLTWISIYTIIWRFTISTFLRYLVVILPALAMVSSHGFVELFSSLQNFQHNIKFFGSIFSFKTILKILLFLVILEGAFLPTMVNSFRGYKTWTFVSPLISRDDYMQTRLPEWWEAVSYFNQQTPPNAVILTYDHSIAYYVNRTCLFVDEPRLKEIHLADNMNDVFSLLRTFNVSHFLDVNYYDNVYVLPNRSFFYRELDKTSLLHPVLNLSQVIIYRVQYAD